MYKSSHPAPAEHMKDPLGITAHARKGSGTAEAVDMRSQQKHELGVNPLWMITGALAAFLILLVAVS